MFELRQINGKRRVIRLLRPSASPLVGVVWGVKQNGSVRWAYGSNTATALYGGTEEMPSSFEFRWFTRDLARDQSAELVGSGTIGDADELVDLFRAVVRERSPVVVRWRHREALAKIAEFTAEEQFLGEYDPVMLKVEWLAPDDIPASALPTKTNAPRDALSGLLRRYSEVLDKGRQPIGMARQRASAFEGALGDMTDALSASAGLVRAYTARNRENEALLGGIAGSFARIESSSQALMSSVGGSSGELAQVGGPQELAQAGLFKAVVQRSAMEAWRKAAIERLTLELLDNGDILEVVSAVEGTDLRVLALKHYGNTEEWDRIASFNGLSGSVVTAGVKIRVPRKGFAI